MDDATTYKCEKCGGVFHIEAEEGYVKHCPGCSNSTSTFIEVTDDVDEIEHQDFDMYDFIEVRR